MLVCNKLAVQKLPLPSVVSFSQLLVSAATVLILTLIWPSTMGILEKTKMFSFALYTVLFAGGLYSNMKALLLANVGAVIAARSCLPLIVCLLEWAFMGRGLPGVRSTLSLVGIVSFAVLYINHDAGVVIEGAVGYAWLLIWWLLIALQMTYGKWMTEKVEMTQWERVFYTNAFAIPPTILLFFGTDESHKMKDVVVGENWELWLAFSCIMGVGISYSGWRTRSLVTATTFTVVGVLNKMATVAFTVVLWPNQASFTSTASLVLCILFGCLYQDAPKRKDALTRKSGEVDMTISSCERGVAQRH